AQPRRTRTVALLALGGCYLAAAAIVGGSLGGPDTATGSDTPARLPFPGAHVAPHSGRVNVSAPFPFPRDRANRAPRPDEVVSLYADGRLCSIGCRPYGAQSGWPLKPFHSQHPLRAGLNELRPGSLHVGV